MEKKTYKWNNISKVSAVPGVYAWYLPLRLSKYDVDSTIAEILNQKISGKEQLAKKTIEAFLQKYIFRSFAEEPYEVEIKGALKPKYEGQIKHTISTSASLIERLYENPNRLSDISEILKTTSPDFSSPIYIGMAGNLHTRLNNHKDKIVRYKGKVENDFQNNLDDETKRDHNFAKRVVERKINETELFVIISPIDTDSDIYKDIENLLNRINFPILGRN